MEDVYEKCLDEVSKKFNISRSQVLELLNLTDKPAKPRVRKIPKPESPIIRYSKPTILPELLKYADDKQLSKYILEKYPLNEILKLATYNSYTEEFIQELYGYRPLFLNPKFDLFPHQLKAIDFMRTREQKSYYNMRGGIISLKMGLGKSLTAAAYTLISPKGEYPTIIIGTKAILPEWKSQCFEKFFGDKAKVLYLHSDFLTKRELDELSLEKIKKYDVVVTTYDVIRNAYNKDETIANDILVLGDEHTLMKGKISHVNIRRREQLKRGVNSKGVGCIFYVPWERIICDESQNFASQTSTLYRAIFGLYSKYKWCLTGTPIRNIITDIFIQYRFLGYDDVQTFKEWKHDGIFINKEQKLTENMILALDYDQSNMKLPAKHDHQIDIKLEKSDEQLIYNYYVQRMVSIIKKFEDKEVKYSDVLAIFLRLRQVTIAPYLTRNDTELPENLRLKVLDQKGPTGIYSSKILEIINIIKNKIPRGEKFIIFSSFTQALDLIQVAIKTFLPACRIVQIDGSIKGNDRTAILTSFRDTTAPPEKYVDGLLMTYKCGSEGLNLVESNHIIFVEPWWTPAIYRQAEARAYRTGQRKEVHTYSLLINHTIDTRILQICEKKDKLKKVLLEGAECEKDPDGITIKELRDMFLKHYIHE